MFQEVALTIKLGTDPLSQRTAQFFFFFLFIFFFFIDVFSVYLFVPCFVVSSSVQRLFQNVEMFCECFTLMFISFALPVFYCCCCLLFSKGTPVKTLPKAYKTFAVDCRVTISLPYLFSWQRLIKMNMPIMGDNTVLFTSTLFALIRTALGIFSTGDPAYADSELRRTIKTLWPKTSKKILEKMIPLQSGKNSTLRNQCN